MQLTSPIQSLSLLRNDLPGPARICGTSSDVSDVLLKTLFRMLKDPGTSDRGVYQCDVE